MVCETTGEMFPMNNPQAILTDPQTITLVGLDRFDADVVRNQHPLRIWDRQSKDGIIGSRGGGYVIPCTAEAVSILQDILPAIHVSDEITLRLKQMDGFEPMITRVREAGVNPGFPFPLDKVKITPYGHQVAAHALGCSLLMEKPGYALLHDMGLGKTLTSLAMIATMGHKLNLVLCPSAVIGVWAQEIAKFCPTMVALPLTGPTVKRAGQLVLSTTVDKPEGDDQLVVITNYESIHRDVFMKALVATDFGLVIADEAHRLKDPGTKQSKAARKIAMGAKRVASTGTPTDKAQDWYGVYRWLDTTVFGSSRTNFTARYFHTYALPTGAIIIDRPREEMLDDLLGRAHSIAHAARKEDVIDLPDKIDVDIPVTLEPAAMKHYREMKNEALTFLDSGEASVGAHTLTRLLRLQQITGGFLEDESVSMAKLTALKSIVSDIVDQGEQVVIFCRFTAEIDAVQELLSKLGMEHGTIDGRVAIGEARDNVIAGFQAGALDAVVVQWRAGGAGITLHAASKAVCYSTSHSLIDWLQGRDRIHRIGQDETCYYYNLVAENTVDVKILEALRAKGDIANYSVHEWRKLLQ